MKNIYLLFSAALILNACSTKKEPSLEEILATNNIEQITSEKIRIDAALQELTANLNKLNRKLTSLNKDKNTPLITTFKVQEEAFTHLYRIARKCSNKTKCFGISRSTWYFKRGFS